MNKTMNQIDKLKDLLDQRGIKINWHHYPTPEQVYAQIPEEILGGVSYDQFRDHFFNDLDKMAEGGTMPDGSNGDVKKSWRKGKKLAVYMDGNWHHFGDSSMDDFRTHKSEKRKDAWYDRHRSALKGDDPRSRAFRVYAKKTWQMGGDMNEEPVPLPNGQEYVFSSDLMEQETGRPFSEVADMLLAALEKGEIQEAEYAQLIMQLVEQNEMAKQGGAMQQEMMPPQAMPQQQMMPQQAMASPQAIPQEMGAASMKRGGYLKDKNTYVTEDGRETKRGLWANVHLKRKGMEEGGEYEEMEGYEVELPDGFEYEFSPDLMDQKTGRSFAEVAQMIDANYKAGKIDDKQFEKMINNLATQNEEAAKTISPRAKQALRCGGYKKIGKNFGGAMDPNMVDGGNLVPVSEDATIIQSDIDKPYTTKLTKEEEKDFRKWFSEVSKYKNLDPNPDAENHYYDYRGYWKNENRDNILQDNSDAHFIDKYKKPGHPTFSTDSIYSNKTEQGGVWNQDDKGTWYFKHSPYTEKYLQRTTEYLDGSGEYSITTKNDTIKNFDDFYRINEKLKSEQNKISNVKKEYKGGGALDPNMVDGGNLVPVSEDATMVQADNPEMTDSVETPNAYLDDKEMVIDMPDGRKYVFSEDLKEPQTGKSFAELAMELVSMRDAGEITEDEYNENIVSLADMNDQVRENTMPNEGERS